MGKTKCDLWFLAPDCIGLSWVSQTTVTSFTELEGESVTHIVHYCAKVLLT